MKRKIDKILIFQALIIVVAVLIGIRLPSDFNRENEFKTEGISKTEEQALLVYEGSILESNTFIGTETIPEGLYLNKHVAVIYYNNPSIPFEDVQNTSIKFEDKIIMQDSYKFKQENGNYIIMIVMSNKQTIDTATQLLITHDGEDKELTLSTAQDVFTQDNLGEIKQLPDLRQVGEDSLVIVTQILPTEDGRQEMRGYFLGDLKELTEYSLIIDGKEAKPLSNDSLTMLLLNHDISKQDYEINKPVLTDFKFRVKFEVDQMNEFYIVIGGTKLLVVSNR